MGGAGCSSVAPQHHGGFVLFGQLPERGVKARVICFHQRARFLDQQEERRIGGILAGGAPMHKTRRVLVNGSHLRCQHSDQRDGGRSGAQRLACEFLGIEGVRVGGLRYRLSGWQRNYSLTCFHARQRYFEIEHRAQDRLAGEQIRERLGGSEAFNETRRHQMSKNTVSQSPASRIWKYQTRGSPASM